ncbi:MAG: hypothetical protein DSM106950_39835 [Stigonema ocellatum SAG 48.90 = DSM 106950]|nr:hypothetical protein [Stigonema ocellatum SAG 48.90 = DSM 106950]
MFKDAITLQKVSTEMPICLMTHFTASRAYPNRIAIAPRKTFPFTDTPEPDQKAGRE